MKILLVTPIQEEIEAFLRFCSDSGERSIASNIGRLKVVQFPSLDLTLAQGGLGKTQFAVQTQHLLDACPGWGLVICAGAAGSLHESLSLGDVVIATETVEHDIHNRFGKPLMPRFQSSLRALELLRKLPSRAFPFHTHFGPITSGDEDVIDFARKRQLHASTGALAVAWEGAGGARACQFSGLPFIEIRGITDNADGSAVTDFKNNLATAVGNVALLVVQLARKDLTGAPND